MYDVDSDQPGLHDVHVGALRPVVVVRRVDELRLLVVVARTTDLDEPGVAHAANLLPGLDQPGVFARRWRHTLDLGLFVEPFVELLGELDADTWQKILQQEGEA